MAGMAAGTRLLPKQAFLHLRDLYVVPTGQYIEVAVEWMFDVSRVIVFFKVCDGRTIVRDWEWRDLLSW